MNIGDTIFSGGQVLQILTQPIYISSAYRPIIFQIQDSTIGHPELLMKGELYARNDMTAPFVLVCTKYEKLYPLQNYFQFNFARNLQTLLSFDRQSNPSLSLITPNNNSIVEYQVRFTEVYLDSNNVMQEYFTVNSDILKAVQATRQHSEVMALGAYTIFGGELPGLPSPDFAKDFNSSFGATSFS